MPFKPYSKLLAKLQDSVFGRHNAKRVTRASRGGRAISIELLEDRLTPASFYWDGSADGSWANYENWSLDLDATAPAPLNTIPTSADDVFLNANIAIDNPLSDLGGDQAAKSVTFSANSTSAITLGNNILSIGSGGIFVESGAAAHVINSGINISDAGAVWTLENGVGSEFTVNGVISGAANTHSLTKTGTGTLILSNAANTWGGSTTAGVGLVINGGTVEFTADGNLGNANNDITLGGGTLRYAGTSANWDPAATRTLIAGTSTSTLSVVDSSRSAVFNDTAQITAGVSGVLVKAGSGALAISAANTGFDGMLRADVGNVSLSGSTSAVGNDTNRATLSLNGGTVSIDSDSALAFFANLTLNANSTVTSNRVTSGAGFTGSAFNSLIANGAYELTLANGPNIASGEQTLTFTTATLNSTPTFKGATTVLASGVWTGSAGFTLDATYTGRVASSGASTFLGDVTVNGGILHLFSTDSSPSTLNASVNSGPLGRGTLRINGGAIRSGNATRTMANPVVIGAGATTSFSKNDGTTAGTNFVFNGPLTFNGGATTLSVFQATGITGFGLQFNGTVSFAEGTALTIADAGGTNTNIAASFGSVAVGAGIALASTNGTGTPTAKFVAATIANNSTATMTFQGPFSAGNTDQTLQVVTGTGNITFGTLNAGTNSPGISVNSSGSGFNVVSGNGTFAGGVVVESGFLSIQASSTPSTLNATVTSGPLGTGTLTLKNGATVLSDDAARTIANGLMIDSGASVNFRKRSGTTAGTTLIFNGPTTFNGGSTTLSVFQPTGVTGFGLQFGGTVSYAEGMTVTVADAGGSNTNIAATFGSTAGAGSGNTLASANATGTPTAPFVAASFTNNSTVAQVITGRFAGGAANQVLRILDGTGPVTLGTLTASTNNPGIEVNRNTSALTTFGSNATFTGGVTLTNGTIAIGADSTGPDASSAFTAGPLGLGTFRIASGTLQSTSGTARYLQNNTILTGGVINYEGTGGVSFTGLTHSIAGTSTINVNGTSTFRLGTATAGTPPAINGATITIAADLNVNINSSGSFTLTNAAIGTGVPGSYVVTGDRTINVGASNNSNTGNFNFSGPGTFNADTTGRTLTINTTFSPAAATSGIQIGSLRGGPGNLDNKPALVINSDINATGTVTFSGGSPSYTGGTTLHRGTAIIATTPTGTTAWTASTARALGVMIVPTTANGYAYEVTTAGTSSGTQPTFNSFTTVGSTFTDGTITYTVRAAAYNATGTGPVTLLGGTLRTDGTARTMTNGVTIAGDITLGAATGSNNLTITPTSGGYASTTTLSGARTITVAGGTQTITGILAGTSSPSLTKDGPWDLVLQNNTATTSSYGNVVINAGRLFMSASSTANFQRTMGVGAYQINNGGTLAFNDSVDKTPSNVITLANGGNISNRANTLTLAALTTNLPTTGTAIFNQDDSNAGTINVLAPIATTGNLTIQVGNLYTGPLNGNGGTVTFSSTGIISGGNNLSKTGNGLLNMTAVHTYTGTTTVLEGTLRAGASVAPSTNGPFGNSATSIVIGNNAVANDIPLLDRTPTNVSTQTAALSYATAAALDAINGSSGTTNFSALFRGKLTVAAAGTWSFGTSSDDGSVIWVDLDGDGIFSTAGASGNELIVDNNFNQGVQARTGNATFAAAGTYNFLIGYYQGSSEAVFEARFSAAGADIPYSSQTIIQPNAGGQAGLWSDINDAPNQLTANYFNFTPNAINGRFFGVARVATLDIGGSFTVSREVVAAGGSPTLSNSTGSGNFTGGVVLNRNAVIDVAGTTLTIGTGLISGPGNLTKTSAGTLTLTNAANSFTGTTSVYAGVLSTSADGNLGPAPLSPTANKLVIGNAGTFRATASYALDANRGVAVGGHAAPTILTRPIFDVGTGLSLTIPSIIADSTSGSGGLTKTGAGLLTLMSANTYTGTVAVSTGTLAVTQNGGLGTAGGGVTVATNTVLDLQNVTYSNAESIILNGGTLRTSTGTSSFAGPISLGANSTIDVSGAQLTVSNTVKLATFTLSVTGAGNLSMLGAISDGQYPGLLQGMLSGSFDITTPNPGTTFVTRPEAGSSQTTWATGAWASNVTWVYTGQFYDEDGIVSFAENIDDNVWVSIDGIVRLNNTSASTPTTTGTLTLTPGWHDIEIRFGNGTGNAGPTVGSNWTATKGFGWSAAGVNSTDGNNFAIFQDPGDGSLLRSNAPLPTTSLIKSGTGTLTLSGANTYNGGTTINGGNVVATVNEPFGGNATSTLTVNGVGTNVTLLDDAAATVTAATVDLSNTSGVFNTGQGKLAIGTQLKLLDGYTASGNFTAQGADLANNNAARTLTAVTGTLSLLHSNNISIVDSGSRFTNTSVQNNTFTGFGVGPAADVLIVSISSRSTVLNNAPSTITYAGMPLTPAVNLFSTISTYVSSQIYYLYNPPAGTADLIVNFAGALASNYAIYAFTLGGVDMTAAPLTGVVAATEGTMTAQSVTVNGVTDGSWAVGEASYRIGTNANLTATTNNGTLLTSGVGGGTGNYWRAIPTDNTIVAAGALVSNLTAGSITVTETGGGAAGDRFTAALAVFAPGGISAVNLPNTHIIAAGTNTLDLGLAGANHVLGTLSAKSGATLTLQNGTLVTTAGVSTAAPSGAGTIAGGGLDLTLDGAGSSTFEVTGGSGIDGSSDKVNSVDTLVYGGTLKIANMGAAFAPGDSWKLFDASSPSGTFANHAVFGTSGDGVNLPSLPVGKWEFNYATGTLSVAPAAPIVTSINPVIGPTTGGTIVTIIGSFFASIDSVTFDGINATTFTVVSTTQINAVTAAHNGVGVVDVVVTGFYGADSLTGLDGFTFAPSVSSVVVNGGPGVVFGASTFSLAGQHSVVRQLLVTFQEAVTVAADAFTVTRRTQNVTVNGGAAPSTVAVVANSVTTISASEYLVTFTGEGTHAGGVINSGVYDLTTLASKVTVGAQTMAADQTTTFFAMFGNIEANNRYNGVPITQPIPQAGYSSGNGLTKAFVDPGSLFQFSDTFGSTATNAAGPPAYNIAFDYNLDGAIDPGDLFAFSDSFGIDWNF